MNTDLEDKSLEMQRRAYDMIHLHYAELKNVEDKMFENHKDIIQKLTSRFEWKVKL